MKKIKFPTNQLNEFTYNLRKNNFIRSSRYVKNDYQFWSKPLLMETSGFGQKVFTCTLYIEIIVNSVDFEIRTFCRILIKQKYKDFELSYKTIPELEKECIELHKSKQ